MKKNKNFINKNKYNDIKRMDHMQMNEYINGVRQIEYERGYKIGRVDGYERGRQEAENRINTLADEDFDRLEKSILMIRGIGREKASKIMEMLRKELKNAEAEKEEKACKEHT